MRIAQRARVLGGLPEDRDWDEDTEHNEHGTLHEGLPEDDPEEASPNTGLSRSQPPYRPIA